MAGGVLTDDIWKNWDKTGKFDFLKLCKQLLKDDSKSPVFVKHGKTSLFVGYIYSLILHGIQGPLKKENVVSTLSEVVTLHTDVAGLICDALNILDAETSTCDQGDERNNFCYIVKESEQFLSDKLLKERLEIDTLQEVGILKNRSFYTKFIKVKTKLYYKQRKFNLFREESEGYSKLIVELNQESSDNDVDILEVIKSLIGCFNLDPNRVLDIILESFENRPDRHEYFIPLVRAYMNDPKIICEVLGSKFTFYQNNIENVTPKSLFTVTALLLQHSIISLEDIYCWLLPDDKQMQKDADKEFRDAKEYCRKSQVISIKEKEDTPEEKDNSAEKYVLNQKFRLCEALLSISDWDNALFIIKKLPDYMVVEQQPIATEICKMLHAIIEPVYRRECVLGPKISTKPESPLKSKMAPKPASTFLELRDVAIPMLVVLGPSLRYDPVLMYKVIRLSKSTLGSSNINYHKNQPTEDTLYYDILTLLDSTILPSLSFMDCNCCIAEEIWNVLKLYPYQCRYCLYSRWKNDTYQLHPKLIVKRGEAQKQIKNIMKRVSKETIKPVGRLIGKLTHSSPGFLLDYMLMQLQIYDNLIHPVVDSLKYLTSLSYDVLGFCLVESLTQVEKNRFKHDGTSISLWLQSLASFCGAIFKKYNIELTGLLQYVGNQLKAQKSLDLCILKEIVQKMAGIEAAEELTDEQLDAMAGGDLLKAEAGYFSQVRNTKKSSLRLKEAMAEQNLAVALCLLIAQQKYCVVYRETENNHLKLVGKLYDQCQDTLVQFGTFLGSTLSVDEYVNKLPTVQSMLQDYHIHADVAFFLARPMFNHAINIKYDQLRKSDPNVKKLSTSAKQQKYYEATKDIMAPIIDSVMPLHCMKVWEDISPQFLVTFWSLTMYDLYVPIESYTREINKIKQLSLAAMDSKDTAGSKSKKEQERYQTLMEKLQDEKKKQHEHVEKVLYRLKQEKDTWFLSRSAKVAKNETITQFLQLCLFPRCVFTAVDSAYCAKFVHTIHMLKTANFATLLCYDRLFCDITYSVTSCTENEANRYGKFLCAMLGTVMRWHSEKTIYDQECANYPGFVTKYRVSNQFSENCDHVGYENYRHVCHKWHYKITKAMIICLESKDYVQIRNALIILIKIIPHFPVLNKLASIIEKKIEKVRDEEKNKRQDLFTLAISYAGQLKLRAGHMIKEADFHHIPEKTKSVEGVVEIDTEQIKSMNGDKEKIIDVIKNSKESKERTDKKSSRQSDSYFKQSKQNPTSPNHKDGMNKERSDSDKTPTHKDGEVKEKHNKKDKEDKREDSDKDRERDREKRKERKEEKMLMKEERQYREERYIELARQGEHGYSNERSQSDRYYSTSERGTHYYEERDLMSGSNNNANVRRSQEPSEPDRDIKRRKLDGPNSKSSKHEDRKLHLEQYGVEKPEKKERSAKTKDKREKISDEEKELRKERKLGRKRQDRGDEALLMEQKRRREETEKAKILTHANGEMIEPIAHAREKHHHSRDKSPYARERERSHDRAELRDKHRRSSEGKRR